MTFEEVIKEYEDNVAKLSPGEHTLLRAAYKAGLRRAQELVKELAPDGPRTCSRAEHGWVRVGFDAFDQAIDAEVAAACKEEP